ncbi:MAG: caspase family protein, partial [Candidatus Thiodiazotropha sp.]
MVKIKSLLDDNLIDRSVVDKLIHFDKLPYDIDDLIHFADKKAITQEYLELALLDGRVEFDASHLLELGRNDYLSRQVAEAFYANGMSFSRNQIQELGRLDIFSLPEVLYTYTIDDGDSATSTGNGDGMIQIREGVDFHFIIKNASRYDIEDVRVVLEQSASAIDLYSQPKNLSVFKMDDTISMDATIGVKSSFKGSTLPTGGLVSSPQFGTMLDEKIDVPVGQTVGSPVLALNKQVSARDSIIVRSGASEKSPRIASLARGAVFTAVGELNGWYKVGVYGRSGWIQKAETHDYNQPTESTFLVENLRESTQGLVDDSKDAGVYGELTFVNAKPVLIIVSPRGGEDVYNAAEMDIQAVDRSFGISKIDVRINGAPLADAAARGLRRLGGVASRELRKTIPLILKKGKNEVEVTAYNSRNVASETQVLHLNSLGIKNPPSMYVLSVGVSRYAREDQNLQYARSDAEKIAALFRKQGGADIYKDVKIKTLYDEEATRSNIKDGVNYFLSEARKDDVAVFYFAGHGTTDARNEYYLMGHDGDMERPSSLGYKNRDLEEDLQSSVYAEKVLVMLDSCRSGQATGRRGAADIDAVVNQLVLASGYNVISAARGNEAAWERSDWGGGAFTYAIVRSLEGGLADASRDGFVSV